MILVIRQSGHGGIIYSSDPHQVPVAKNNTKGYVLLGVLSYCIVRVFLGSVLE
jgi:hypothetical protein